MSRHELTKVKDRNSYWWQLRTKNKRNKKSVKGDLRILCKKGWVSCHGLVVGTSSPYFSKILAKKTNTLRTTVVDSELCSESVETVMKLLYVGSLQISRDWKEKMVDLLTRFEGM
jgi:hypothetical protein